MSDVYGGPIPLCQELVDCIIDGLKDERSTLQSCRLVSRPFQKQTRVERYLFQKIVFPRLYKYWSNEEVHRSKSLLLGLAPHVHALLVNRGNSDWIVTYRGRPTATTTDEHFEVEDISRFENLKTLGIVNVFWDEPQFLVGSALCQSLTTLELSAGPSAYMEDLKIPSVRKLLQFILAFPNLSSLGLQRVRLASPIGETVDDLMSMSGPTLRKLRLDFKTRDRRAADTFVSVLRAVAIDPSVLEELYISGHEDGIELVKSCSALRVLTLILENARLRLSPCDTSIGFYLWNIYEIDKATLEWFKLSLLDTTRPTQLKHFTMRCNADGGEDTWGCKRQLMPSLQPIDEILSTLPLSTFTITTSFDNFQDNPLCIGHVGMAHEGIRACFSAMKKNCAGSAKHEEVESEPGWTVLSDFPVRKTWYLNSVYQLK